MNKHVQVRNLPEATHRRLKLKAIEKGVSVSAFLRRLIEEELDKPSWDDIVARMRKLSPIRLKESTASMVRRERDSR